MVYRASKKRYVLVGVSVATMLVPVAVVRSSSIAVWQWLKDKQWKKNKTLGHVRS